MMTTATSGPSDPTAEIDDIVVYLRDMKDLNLAPPERKH